MTKRAGTLSAMGAAVVALTLAIAVPVASAAFGVAKWEAGTCMSDAPKCTYSSPESQFFTQAAGHPPTGLTDFAMTTTGGVPDGAIKDARVYLPEGLNVNPQAVPQCPKATFESNAIACAASYFWISAVTTE